MEVVNPWPMYVDVFYLACGLNDTGMMERLLTTCSPIAHARLGPDNTPTLLIAITSSSLGVLRVLLRHGADPTMSPMTRGGGPPTSPSTATITSCWRSCLGTAPTPRRETAR